MSFIERNLQALREKQPKLAELVSADRGGDASKRLLPTKDGHATLEVVSSNGHKSLLHSRYAPLMEAKRLVDSFEIEPATNLVVLGLGLGYHLIEMMNRPGNRDFILVVEKDPETFKAFLSIHDISRRIALGEVAFAVNEGPQEIFRRLQFHALTILENGVKAVKHPPSVRLDTEYYNRMLQSISELVVWAKVNTNTQIKSGRKYAANVFENIHMLLANSGVRVLKNLFPKRPAIIVSAGPSLTKNVTQLRMAYGKAVIVCVDTALRVLLMHEIRPDIVVSIDFTPHNQRYFDELDTGDLVLVSDLEVYPEILRRFEGRKLLMNLPMKSICEWFSNVLGDFGSIEKGLSVAHAAFLLAFYMGCDPVVFTGQDLAYSEELSHARGTSMSRREAVSSGKENVLPVQDIFGKRILTHVSMHVFLKHLEELICSSGKRRPFTCIDATEGGARIHGAAVKSLKEVICSYCTEDFSPAKKILDSISAEKPIMAEDLLTKSVKMSQKLGKIAEICKSGKTLMQKVEKCCSKGASSKGLLDRLQSDYAGISRSLSRYVEEMKILKDITVEEMILQAKKMPVDETPEALFDYISRSSRFYSGLADSSEFLAGKFHELSERLRNEKAGVKESFF